MKTDYRQQDSLYHQILMDVLEWLEDATGLEFTQTSTYRDGDNGVHGTIPLRGVDLRCLLTPLGREIESLTQCQRSRDTLRQSCTTLANEHTAMGEKLNELQFAYDNLVGVNAKYQRALEKIANPTTQPLAMKRVANEALGEKYREG